VPNKSSKSLVDPGVEGIIALLDVVRALSPVAESSLLLLFIMSNSELVEGDAFSVG